MNPLFNTISSSVLSKDISDCTTDELAQLATTHPYSGALQLLYAQKLYAEKNEDFNKQWQKTLLYFNNPLLLQHIISTPQNETRIVEKELADQPEVLIDERNPTIKIMKEKEWEEKETDENTVNFDEKDEAQKIDIPGLKIEPIDPEKAAFSYTPYFTVDYFASQGIKLGEEMKAADRFGNQLKTFTSWLKEMRRLPEADVVSKFSSLENRKIEQMAEQSLTGENADTLSMAEVWVKQGNPKKAIDIYKKLSLQNPAKSAFFAAKIEHLKKQL